MPETQYPPSRLPLVDLLLVTVRQAAKELDTTERTVWDHMVAGRLPFLKINNVHRIDLEDVKRIADLEGQAA
jgi:hypothetical protein